MTQFKSNNPIPYLMPASINFLKLELGFSCINSSKLISLRPSNDINKTGFGFLNLIAFEYCKYKISTMHILYNFPLMTILLFSRL